MNSITAATPGTLPNGDAFISNAPLPLTRVFYPLGFAVEIHTNHEAALEAARHSWGHCVRRHDTPAVQLHITVSDGGADHCPPSPIPKLHGDHMAIVADARNHAICDMQSNIACLWLSRPALEYASYIRYHFIEAAALFLIATSFVTPLHAACVSLHGRGMLLCADSGTGKSTLAYACARAGWSYTTDDSSYLLRGTNPPRVIGNSRQVRFRPTARELFQELAQFALTPRAEGKPSIEVPIVELLPHIDAKEEAQIDFLLFLKRESSAMPQLTPISPASARERLRVGDGLGPAMEQLYATYLQSLLSLPLFEFRYSELQPAIDCLELLAREAARRHA